MTDEEINIKIAEACGWRRTVEGKDIWTFGEYVNYRQSDLPDYLNDLNTIDKACEDAFADYAGSWEDYAHALQDVTEGTGEDGDEMFILGIRATARQRAEAFLKTIEE